MFYNSSAYSLFLIQYSSVRHIVKSIKNHLILRTLTIYFVQMTLFLREPGQDEYGISFQRGYLSLNAFYMPAVTIRMEQETEAETESSAGNEFHQEITTKMPPMLFITTNR